MDITSLKKIYNPRTHPGPLRLAGFMSGSGTNLIKIIEQQKKLEKEKGKSPFEMVVIFTDTTDPKKCQAKKIAERYGIDYVGRDIGEFYQKRGHQNKKDLSLRSEFDLETVRELKKFNLDLIALGGYMSIITKPLIEAYAGKIINVHPANLTVLENGRRKYTGDNAIYLAIKNGEDYVSSTTHIVREKVDYGEILMLSPRLNIILPKDLDIKNIKNKEKLLKLAKNYQKKLKIQGDWIIFPKTIKLIAEGRFALDDDGKVYVDGEYYPNGYQF